MKRLLIIPFLSAVIGAGVVVAVIAAAGDLGKKTSTVTTERPPLRLSPRTPPRRATG